MISFTVTCTTLRRISISLLALVKHGFGQLRRDSIFFAANGRHIEFHLNHEDIRKLDFNRLKTWELANQFCSDVLQIDSPVEWCVEEVFEQLENRQSLKWAPMTSMKSVETVPYLDVLLRAVRGSVHPASYEPKLRHAIDARFTTLGLTMLSEQNLNSLRQILLHVHEHDVRGDVVECGVWKGGAMMFAKGVLRWLGSERSVWLMDSFKGLPPATLFSPGLGELNSEDHWSRKDELRVPVADVQESFRNLDLLDDRVHFVEGFFNESLPGLRWADKLPVVAVLRIDADMYEGYMDVLFNLYDHVSVGGFIIADDFGIFVAQQACLDFRRWHNITAQIWQVDEWAVYWQKERAEPVQFHIYDYIRAHRVPDQRGRDSMMMLYDHRILRDGVPMRHFQTTEL